MKKALIYAILIALGIGSGQIQAHEGHHTNTMTNLKTLLPSQQVIVIGYCQGTYEVKLKDNSTVTFKEFDLRFKIDSGPNGPNTGNALLIPAGMGGDRAFVIFSDPSIMATFFKKTC